jgi:thiol-disulfide isomerase/thioredoxin
MPTTLQSTLEPSMDFADQFKHGLSYDKFLTTHGTADQQLRWKSVFDQVKLSPAQLALLTSFKREMKVLCVAGAWCGDCVSQCPIFAQFAAATPQIQLRFFDRDVSSELAQELSVCGAPRVPAVLFLSEDNFPCGRYGDRTISKYRQVASDLEGVGCSTGIVQLASSLFDSVIQDWLNEFERIQLILRTSGRLRKLHGD